MSTFTTPASVELLDNYHFRLIEPFLFYVGEKEAPDTIFSIPAGFETDLASVPRLLWSLLPPHGRYAKAAILHDWLLTQAPAISRPQADELFYQAMLILGVPTWQAKLMYYAVRTYSKWTNWRAQP